jgi:TonB-dependent starch-binding outer membrane protein SusC
MANLKNFKITRNRYEYFSGYKFILISTLFVLVCTFANANIQQQVTGTVSDRESGETLPGVSVLVRGTTVGTITDVEGKYSLSVPDRNSVLVFSFVGYTTLEVPMEGRTVVDILLSPVAIDLDEVVVVGYGTQRRATLTGSVTGITSNEIVKTPSQNLSSSLSGLLPGLVSLQRSGQPGADNATILVRGNSTTGSNAPLVLVDGIPESGWQRINPNDIESISVLKDAAAAIYGVQAANGVILITTKRGSVNKPTFDFSINQGFSRPTRTPEMASSATLAEYGNDYLVRTGADPLWSEEQIQLFRDGTDPRYPNTNWPGEMLKAWTPQETVNLNVRGGVENIRYSFSGSYQHQDDIIKNGIHTFKNYSVRSNIDTDVNKNITLSLDLNVGQDERYNPNRLGWYHIYALNPQYPVYYPGGYPSNPPSDYGDHPAVIGTGGSGYNRLAPKRFSGRFAYNIRIPAVSGLSVDGYFNYRNTYTHQKIWNTPWTIYGYNWDTGTAVPIQGGTVGRPELDERFNQSFATLIHARARYERQFENHFINAFIAVEQEEGSANNIRVYRRDYLSSAIDEIFAGSADRMATDGSSSRNARQNLFGRVSYNYQEKYLLDFNFRYDGSYRFPRDKRWGFFPGISVAYRISEENFLRDIGFLDDFKIRASYGQLGNDAINPFQFLQSYTLNSIGYHFGAPMVSAPQSFVLAGVNPNPNVTWEVSTMQNVGFDALFLSHLLGVSVDFFQQRRENILTTRALEIPLYTQLRLPAENIGIVENRGVELALNHRNSLGGGRRLSYYVTGNVAFARSKVIDVSEAADIPDYQKQEGKMLGAMLLYEALGIFRTQEQLQSNPRIPGSAVGDLIYQDINDDGVITSADMVRMNRSNIPEITFGLNMSLNYRNWGLFAHFAGQGRAWQFIHQNARVDLNAPAELLENRYRAGSMDSKYPWIPQYSSIGTDISGQYSTFWLQDASFLRLKTAEISYSLRDLVSRYGIERARIFVNGNNLFTLTKMKWYDPEGGNQRGEFYPQQQIFSLGAQLTF